MIQDFGGNVIGMRVLQCDADDLWRNALSDALHHTSPLPPYPGTKPIDGVVIDFQISNVAVAAK